MIHPLPFQRSASVMFPVVPTVMQLLAEAQETLAGATRDASPGAPGGVDNRWISHRVPFHRSAIARAPRS
jgi:hypothetical protein